MTPCWMYEERNMLSKIEVFDMILPKTIWQKGGLFLWQKDRYMWVYTTGENEDKKIVLYDYKGGRTRE